MRRAATLVLALALPLAGAAAQPNVALGKPVTLDGVFGVLRPGSGWEPAPPPAAAATITDGVFRPEMTTWTDGTVWWDATVAGAESNGIVIDLGGLYRIGRMSIQADNNDEYVIDWRAGTAGAWTTLGFFTGVAGFGMMTRGPFDVPVFEGRQIRIRGAAGDQFYAVSELQAFGTVVPEPATVALVGGGLALLGLGGRRRRA